MLGGGTIRDAVIVEGSALPSRNVYDAAGVRTLRVDPDGTSTVYLAGTEIRATPTGVTVARSYPGGTRRNFNGTTTIAITDHHNSINTILDTTTGTVEYTAYAPYGAVRSGTTLDDHGYLAAPHDPGGLIYLQHRHHDPTTGTFTQVDPLTTTTQQPYTYAGGNPIRYSDPTGLRRDCDCGKTSPEPLFDDQSGPLLPQQRRVHRPPKPRSCSTPHALLCSNSPVAVRDDRDPSDADTRIVISGWAAVPEWTYHEESALLTDLPAVKDIVAVSASRGTARRTWLYNDATVYLVVGEGLNGRWTPRVVAEWRGAVTIDEQAAYTELTLSANAGGPDGDPTAGFNGTIGDAEIPWPREREISGSSITISLGSGVGVPLAAASVPLAFDIGPYLDGLPSEDGVWMIADVG